jgi:hypothetical protein
VCYVSLPSSYRSRRGHIHLPRVLPLVGCRSKTPTEVDNTDNSSDEHGRTSRCASGRRRHSTSLLRQPEFGKVALLRRWPLRARWPATHLLPTSALRLTPPKTRAAAAPTRLAYHGGQVGKGEADLDGATFRGSASSMEASKGFRCSSWDGATSFALV